MIELRPFQPSDLDTLDVQPEHRAVVEDIRQSLTPLALTCVLVNEWSWTAWSGGKPVASCGILKEHPYAWAILGADLRHEMVAVTRAVRHVLDAHLAADGHILATIDDGNRNAVKWAKFLHFEHVEGDLWIYD